MDERLVRWARAVKSRNRWRGADAVPPLWLFTDPVRAPDAAAMAAGLPRGLCGVVLRHGDAALRQAVARACRARRTALVVAARVEGGPAGAAAGSIRAGRHLRRGRLARQGRRAGGGMTTSSAHGVAELVRARRAGVRAAFLSPVWPTRSHPGAPGLGVVRFAGLARHGLAWHGLARGGVSPRPRLEVLALGGVDGIRARRLPRWVTGVGAIGAMTSGQEGFAP